ncbi:MAG: GIY-YIG nuclease family protein [Bacteroidetes bacterium]|jgi:putative endonuclease|nr:GIY-YIG nuclease family protein [Bacteroidota bacterium]
MFYVYAIYSLRDHRIYVGLTTNTDKRLKAHNAGHTRSTKAYCPWQIFYYEIFSTRELARNREKYFKSGIGKERLREKLLEILK